jgi:hypothetical protein
MSQSEFMTMCKRLFSFYSLYTIPYYNLSTTPLNEALVHLLKIIPEYKKKNGIQKLSLITLTDGDSDFMESYISGSRRFDPKLNNVIVNDDMTKKTYIINNFYHSSNVKLTGILLDMIRDRYDVTSIGFHIAPNKRREIFYTIRNMKSFCSEEEIQRVIVELNSKGFYSFAIRGRDKFFLIRESAHNNDVGIKDINSDTSASSIAKKLSKAFGDRKKSNVVLDRFMDYIC